MNKFRRLDLAELKELEKEFVEFLIINGITADDWIKIKEENNDKADKIIDQFSEVVFSSIFRKNQFIDFIEKDEIKCFQFLDEKIVLVGIKNDDPKIDLTKATKEELKNREFQVYTLDKKYTKPREEEMFDLVQSGAILSDGELFKKLCLGL